MKRIFVLRTAPYNYLIEGKNLYESFDLVARRKLNPSVDKTKGEELLRNNLPHGVFTTASVLCSKQKRSFETARLITKNVYRSSLLREIDYGMRDFISQKQFYARKSNPDINKARQRFVNGFINNKLQEKYAEVIRRVEIVLAEVEQIKSKNIVLVSHGFFMKVTEAYIRDNDIKYNTQRLLKYFSGGTETFHFCEGFEVSCLGRRFVFKRYIRNKGGNL